MKQISNVLLHFRFLIVIIAVCPSFQCLSQTSKGWTSMERQYYMNLKGLCSYLVSKHDLIDIQDSSIQKYLLLDYVLNDTSEQRKKDRLERITTLLGGFRHFIDSVGLSNLDAKPIRFFKGNSKFYKPFSEELKDAQPLTFAYFDKRHPNNPYGYLLFHRESRKLVTWILINQGGYHYFLVFNLI